jgi:hypothetical protein
MIRFLMAISNCVYDKHGYTPLLKKNYLFSALELIMSMT